MKGKQPLKEQMDNLIPKLRQIDNHALSKADVHTKQMYMYLLAAIAFEDRKVSDKEKRYLQALCNGIKEIEYKTIISGIDRIGDNLEYTLKVLEQNNLGLWLFIDALILCRLDSEITEKESELLGSLADSLKLTLKEVSFCLKMATIILSQDEALLYEMIAEVPKDFPFYALLETYTSSWFEAKFSFAEELAEGRVLKGKYFIHKPVRLSGERELKDIELVFAEGTSITIEKDAKLKIIGSQLNQAEIICSEKSSLDLSGCNFSGGKGIYSGINSFLSVSQCRFDNIGIASDKASKIELDEVIFENFTDKRAMSLTNCMNVVIKKSKFISCGFDPKNTKKEEGGALLISGCAILIDTCQFENCTASGNGGAISIWETGYGIKDSKFFQCKSGLNGGAMVVHDTFYLDSKKHGIPSLISLVYGIHNSDSNRGNSVPISIDVEFVGCEAANFGGAVMSYTRNLRFFNCLFEKCSAAQKGGGVTVMGYELGNSYNRFFACNFVENTAAEGSGLWMQRFRCGNKSVFMIEDPEMVNNDIRDSIFHKCRTNHIHGKNSDNIPNCSLNKQNTFTN